MGGEGEGSFVTAFLAWQRKGLIREEIVGFQNRISKFPKGNVFPGETEDGQQLAGAESNPELVYQVPEVHRKLEEHVLGVSDSEQNPKTFEAGSSNE